MDSFFVWTALFFSAFFSGMEIAYVSSDKLRIEIDKQKGGISAKIIAMLAKRPDKYIATMLLGNNAALVIYGLIMAKLLEPQVAKFVSSEFWILIIQTFLSTLLILFAAEFIPKTLFRLNPNSALKIFAVPVYVIYVILYPLTWLTIQISNFFLRFVLKSRNNEQKANYVFGKIDLDAYLERFSEPSEDIEEEIKIIRNTLDFEHIRLKECIIPRNEIVAIEVSSTIEELSQIIIETGFSKIPVYEQSIDNIIGYVHVHSLYLNPKNIKEAMVDIPIVPETMTAQKLFNILLKRKRSMALVVDEYGGTSGIVTIEDILEEIFGEIEDEHDQSEIVGEKIDENTFLFSGRTEVDYINDEFGLNIPDSDKYETIAGLILQKLERFPEKGEVVDFDDFKIVIIEAEQPRIEKIKLILKENN